MSEEGTQRLERRLQRERRARQEAEAIAERVTSELYASGQELERLNSDLTAINVELQAVNRSIRDFVAVASHDLRGPLTAIVGFASMLTEHGGQVSDEDTARYIAIILRQGKHLARLIEDLLTVSKIEAGALDVHHEVVRLHEVVRDAIEEFTQHVAEIHVAAPVHLTVVADPEHLHRILANYLGNALKYGAPPFEIEAAEADGYVEIRVRDSGEGVPEEFVPRLFARFARADTEGTRAQAGTGLGLSIVQGLAQANGGETWYEPNAPHGSCFAVRLPKPASILRD